MAAHPKKSGSTHKKKSTPKTSKKKKRTVKKVNVYGG